MQQLSDLSQARSREALEGWADQCRQDFKLRWPKIAFDGDAWPLRSAYGTKLLDVRFDRVISDFEGRDGSYVLAFRCLVAHLAFDAKVKLSDGSRDAWRMLKDLDVPLAALERHHLVQLESSVVKAATAASALRDLSRLYKLGLMIERLAARGAVGHLAWLPSGETREKLNRLVSANRKSFHEKKSIDILDRQIEGLSDATAAMLRRDSRLSPEDCSAIAAANILMCAPARINEPLCMQVGSRITIADYAMRPQTEKGSNLFQAHQLLLMKGSKGADWSGKPVLNFMVALADTCWQVILNSSQRSRMLVKHYESHPDRLYLPPELEHLRGQPVTQASLWQIVNLSQTTPSEGDLNAIRGKKGLWLQIAASDDAGSPVNMITIPNPRSHIPDGRRNPVKRLIALPWSAVESLLLKKVSDRMARMRKVVAAGLISYEGPLSEMLLLVDTRKTPYLPNAWDDDAMRARFKTTASLAKQGKDVSVFKKLGLKMLVNAELVDCFIEPHDTRRWLTTQALQARERLSDVLINKWANRIKLGQLKAYDRRPDERKAEQAAMPLPHVLESLSKSIEEIQSLVQASGLKTQFITAHGDGLAVTDMNALETFAEDTPAARCGNEIIILTPTAFGVCLHQHTEAPCRSYVVCDRCSKQATCKGHKPTNDAWRDRAEKTNRVIYLELDRHIKEHNRQIADDVFGLEAHLLAQVGGLDVEAMTKEMIEGFHEIKDRIHDPNFKRRLEQAYVARSIVTMLDSPDVANGALIMYHNPGVHNAPGHERAMEEQLGSRSDRDERLRTFYAEHPDLAPRPVGLKDERALLLELDNLDDTLSDDEEFVASDTGGGYEEHS